MSGAPVRKPQRRLPASARRALIVEAAIACFAERGYDQTAMDDVAAAAVVSKPVLYDHFPSKSALYAAVLVHLSETLFTMAADDRDAASSTEAAVSATIARFVEFVGEHAAAADLLFRPVTGQGPHVEAALAVQRRAAANIAGLLLAHGPELDPALAALAADFIKAGLHAAARHWWRAGGLDRDDVERTLSALCWSGLSGLLGPGGKAQAPSGG